MKKIFSFEVFDIVASSEGIILAQKELYNGTSYKISFIEYSVRLDRKTPVTKAIYQGYKFGEKYQEIAEALGDYASCNTASFANDNLVVVYPSGETGVFDKEGRRILNVDLLYKDCPITGCATENAQFWSAVPKMNAIVSYSIPHRKFSMRIGAENSSTFVEPVDVTRYGDELYVCCAGSNKIRTVSLDNYFVNDLYLFEEPVYKYLRSVGEEFVVLASGVYML